MTSASSSRAAALLACLFLASTAFAQFTFSEALDGSPNQPTDVFVGDFNGDGLPDIVTTQSQASAVTVYLNNGDGTFTDMGSASYPTGLHPLRVVAADFNGDGILDLATANDCVNPQPGPPGSISIMFGNGDGTFQPATTIPLDTGECPNSLALTKVNSSNWDLAVGINLGKIDLFLNDGNGNFSFSKSIPSPGGPQIQGISSAPYNGDGIYHLAAITQSRGDDLFILYNDGAGNYTPQLILDAGAALGSSNFHLQAANSVDLNGDGLADLLVPFAPITRGTQSAGVIAMVNNGNGTFTLQILTVDTRFNVVGWKAAERNFSNRAFHDIVLPISSDPSTGPDAFAVFPGTSGNTWGGPQYFFIGVTKSPQAAAIGDFNNDGNNDFAGVTQLDSTLHVYTNFVPSDCTPPRAGVGICLPRASSPETVQIFAGANGGSLPIVAMAAYIDGQQVASSSTNSISAPVQEADGQHLLVVNASDSAGNVYSASKSFNVAPDGDICAPTGAGALLCSPVVMTASALVSPIYIEAGASGGSNPIAAMTANLDGQQVASSSNEQLIATVSAANGQHELVINAWDTSGVLHQVGEEFTVASSIGNAVNCQPPPDAGVLMCSPPSGGTVFSPANISASSNGGSLPIVAMVAYINGTQVGSSSSHTLNVSVAMPPGTYTLNVNAWNSNGDVFTSQETFTVR